MKRPIPRGVLALAIVAQAFFVLASIAVIVMLSFLPGEGAEAVRVWAE